MQSASPRSQATSPSDSFMASLSQVHSTQASPQEFITVITPTGEKIVYQRPTARVPELSGHNAETILSTSVAPGSHSRQGTHDDGIPVIPIPPPLPPHQSAGGDVTTNGTAQLQVTDYDMNAFAAFLAGNGSFFDLGMPTAPITPSIASPILGSSTSSLNSLTSPPADPTQQYPTPTDEDAPPPHSQFSAARSRPGVSQEVGFLSGPSVQRSISTSSLPAKRTSAELSDGVNENRKLPRITPASKYASTASSDSTQARSPTYSPMTRGVLPPHRTRSAPPTPPQSGGRDMQLDSQNAPNPFAKAGEGAIPHTPTSPSMGSKFCVPDVDFFMKRVQDGKDSKNPAKISCALVDNMINLMGRVVNQTSPRPNPPWTILNTTTSGTEENKAVQRARTLLAKVLLEEGIDGAQETYKAFQLMILSDLGEKMCMDLRESEVCKGRGVRAGDLYHQ